MNSAMENASVLSWSWVNLDPLSCKKPAPCDMNMIYHGPKEYREELLLRAFCKIDVASLFSPHASFSTNTNSMDKLNAEKANRRTTISNENDIVVGEWCLMSWPVSMQTRDSKLATLPKTKHKPQEGWPWPWRSLCTASNSERHRKYACELHLEEQTEEQI